MSSLFNFIRRQLKDVLQIQRKQHNSVIWVEYAKDFVHNKIYFPVKIVKLCVFLIFEHK